MKNYLRRERRDGSFSRSMALPAEVDPSKIKAKTKETPAPPRTIATVAPGPRRTIASYANYADAESAVDRLADHGFPVERSAIVGTGLRSVEQVGGRMTAGRAAFVGAAGGIFMGALFALLAGLFPWDSGSAEILGYALVVGAVFGAVSGALVHEALSAGRRDFISVTRIEAERYDLQVGADSADEAERLLRLTSPTAGTRGGNRAQ